MTYEQIIKALEYCCGNITFNSDCFPHGNYYVSLPEGGNGDMLWYRQLLMKNALELIKRQKTENEELRERISYLEESIDCSRKEYNQLLQKLQQAKSEAIKEFAERLKKRFYLLNGRCVVDIPQINNLVKEMTEVQE